MTWWADRRALSALGCRKRFTQAAGISSVTLVCHPQTWAEIEAIAGELRPRVKVTVVRKTSRDDGLAEIALSGAQLAAVMHALRAAYFDGDDLIRSFRTFSPPRRAVARRVYLAMARTVEQVSSTHTGTIPPIVIDDRTPGTGGQS